LEQLDIKQPVEFDQNVVEFVGLIRLKI